MTIGKEARTSPAVSTPVTISEAPVRVNVFKVLSPFGAVDVTSFECGRNVFLGRVGVDWRFKVRFGNLLFLLFPESKHMIVFDW